MKILVCACAALMLSASAAGAGKMMKEQELIELENAWSKAVVQHDVATVSSIVADDWMGQNDSGKVEDKVHLLDEMKSGKMSATSMANRDMHARIMRGVGIVQGSDDEKSMSKGKDSSGSYTWMDVFEMRDGRWQAIASQITKVK
jgi:predicted HNH restriction endonuclease